jgi:hypothetical protein
MFGKLNETISCKTKWRFSYTSAILEFSSLYCRQDCTANTVGKYHDIMVGMEAKALTNSVTKTSGVYSPISSPWSSSSRFSLFTCTKFSFFVLDGN